jgi:TPR repeat protein
MAADIFISYAREDEGTAIHLRDVLAGQGWDVWRDKEGILTGTSWEKAIEDALDAAKCVIVVWSRAALSSHFVRDEASVARNANKLVPVQIETVDIPLGFRGIQTANLVGWKGDVEDAEFRKLIRALAERVGANPSATGTTAPPPHPLATRMSSLGAARVGQWLTSKPALFGLAAAFLFGAGYLLGREQARATESEAAHEALAQGIRHFLDGKHADAAEQLERALSAGSGGAGYYLSRMFRDGLGLKQDDSKALSYAQKGAARGNVQSETMMGWLLYNAKNITKDEVRAFGWYLRAADHGDPWAAYDAGLMYESGYAGKPGDLAKAVDYYRRAADLGVAPAGNALGNLYASGRGVRQDAAKAFQWYRWAADKGDANAQVSLGYMYANGQATARDDAKAFELYKRAADQNNASGVNNVGYFHEFGRAVPLNLNEAAVWYERAVRLGDKNASGNLGRVQEKLRSGGPARR